LREWDGVRGDTCVALGKQRFYIELSILCIYAATASQPASWIVVCNRKMYYGLILSILQPRENKNILDKIWSSSVAKADSWGKA